MEEIITGQLIYGGKTYTPTMAEDGGLLIPQMYIKDEVPHIYYMRLAPELIDAVLEAAKTRQGIDKI
jgi:hypothetical protein